MHFFGSSRERTPRFFAYFNTPDNPICWLKGHTPKGEVVVPKYIKPYLIIRCVVCDRQYNNAEKFGNSFRNEDYKEVARRQIEVFQHNPKMFLSDIDKRGSGWGSGKLELKAEFSFPKKLRKECSFRVHTGTRASETPYDAHFTVGGWGIYLGMGGLSGRWAEFIGRGHGRDISLSIHNGSLWWKLWYDGNGGNDEHHRCDTWRRPKLWPWSMGRKKHRGWMCLREGNIALNPVSAFYGSRKWLLFKESESQEAVVDINQFPADEYTVKFRLNERHVRRDAGPAWARRIVRKDLTVEWDASDVGGIPVMNHDWKGDEILSGNLPVSTLKTWDGKSDWLPLAVEGLKDLVVADRIRYQYRPPVREVLDD